MKITISENQRKVLECLARIYDDDSNCGFFRWIAQETKLSKREVRLACRALARKGLTEWIKGLFDDDGMVAGSGYCATEKGAALISHCDLCEKRNVYEYEGKKECEEHYGKSKIFTSLKEEIR